MARAWIKWPIGLISPDVRSPLLPGYLLVLYDLFRGFPRQVTFCADAARRELRRAYALFGQIPPGTLLVADRLYASGAFFQALVQNQLWGVD